MRAWHLFFSLWCSVGLVHAQQAVLTTGGDASGSSGSVSFSLGQVTDEAQNNDNGIVSQGVQQTYPDIPTAVHTNGPNEVASVFPTVSNGTVNLVLPEGTGSWSVTLFDSNGRLVYTAKLAEGTHELSLRPCADGMYQLRLRRADGAVQTFTLIRTASP